MDSSPGRSEPTFPPVPSHPLTPANIRAIVLEGTGPAGNQARRPIIVAINGRSASGKSTLAAALTTEKRWEAIGTDDVAWWHSFFGWTDVLIDGVLVPARRGERVSFRPDAWHSRGREGAIIVPKETAVLIIEGVGASRRELQQYLDYSIWLHTDAALIEERETDRARQGESTTSFQKEWTAEEIPFLQQDQPWTRANLILTADSTQPGTYQALTGVTPPP